MKPIVSRIVFFVVCLLFLGVLFSCKTTTEVTTQTYMVTFSKNISDVTVSNMPSPQNIVANGLVTRPASDPTTTLYEFTGWYSDAACQTPFDFDTIQVTGRLTIYAGWLLIITNYDVTFDLNYPSAPVLEAVEVISGETVAEPTDPTREGYRFLYWSTDSVAEYVFDFENSITSNLHLYAMWEAIYSLTYSFNNDVMEDLVEYYGSTENTVRFSDPVREDFAFGGWYSDPQCTIAYAHGTQLSADTVIYAKWIRTDYNVTFDLNYPGSTPIAIKAHVNSDVPNPASPIREGFVFDNWYTSATEHSEEYLFDFSPVSNDTTILYAHWIPLYIVTYNFNYVGSPNPTTQSILDGSELVAITPTREGYLFSGWFTEPDCLNAYSFAPVHADLNLYAAWIDSTVVHDEFTVTFDLNYDGAESFEQIVVSGTVAVRPEDPSRDGYRFAGWVTSSTGSTTYRFEAVTGNVTVYARWVNLWTITFNLDYEDAPAPQVIETLDGTRISKPANPTREGLWTFVTWNDEGGSPFIFTTVIQRSYELHAVWSRSGYTITWDFNFVGAPSPILTDVMNGSIAREPEKPYRDGNWAISGWYTDAACTIPYSLSSVLSEDITIYAKWASGYAYQLDLNYVGAPSIPTQILSEGFTIPLRPTDPVRSGYTFVGWAVTANGNPDYNGFGSIVTEDVILYAQWRHTYVFEAEYVDLAGKNGAGWSGGAAGTAMIVRDTITDNPELGTNANASNGFFLSYLYSSGLYIDFVITSDRAIDATLILRFSAEQMDPFTITDSDYLITLNDTKVVYDSITITGAYAALQQQKLPFNDVISITISLNEGVNVLRFTTNNQISMGGTMDATAPLFDCIKIDTIAVLSWNPVLSNLDLFE